MTVFSTTRPLLSCAIIGTALMLNSTSFSANAALSKQNLQSSGYWGGILLPDNAAISASELNTIYNRFVNNYIVNVGSDKARVKWGSGGALRDGSGNVSKDAYATASEGMGYGMLITAYGNDKTRFDKLYRFYKKTLDDNNADLMPWLVWDNASPVTNQICYGIVGQNQTCFGAGGGGPATDGDIDIAMALFVAADKWSGTGIDYRAEAIHIVNELHDNWLHWCADDGGTWVVKPYQKSNFNPCTDEIDASYSIPAFFRFFAEVAALDSSVKNTNDRWNSAARDLYSRLLDKQKAGPNGDKTFVPDWMKLNGSAVTGRSTNYGSDASRIPWRVTMDYAWYGTDASRNWTRRLINDLVNNANNGDISGIEADISQSSGNSAGYNGRSFSGGFAVAAMLYDWYPANANNYTNHWVNETLNGSLPWNIGANGYENANNDYYGMALSALYALTLTGNTYKPAAN
ncbi:glycosyl hydrolase family 8 [Agarivorans sp. TSD2052]|uniref:glycosyl hydrolase family 8 n=1 Tax=Agarivorans sp. TSD2052 TaxID=2937286 RepID=UPI0020102543|nr:glycosyl hydrolase family 8 [Agarivorans sp. TSD2052]UPW17320.1 glycosyl hydrolase family 8 [Agarivorans sp. TSD2052]